MQTSSPVSYTHLDVYKRQAFGPGGSARYKAHREQNRRYIEGADWMMCEAFCLYADRDTFKPYELSLIHICESLFLPLCGNAGCQHVLCLSVLHSA